MPSKVTIIDYHCGNLKSVEQAIAHIGAEVEMTSDPEVILAAEKLILPGVGAFPVGMENIKSLNLFDAIITKVNAGTPILGICLGMQLLLEHSDEHGGADGLGLIKGQVKKIVSTNPSLKLPHIGWCKLEVVKENDALLSQADYFYFVHTYMALPENESAVLAKGQYEDVEFCAAVSQDNIWGMQFHPENSADAGLAILKAFAELPLKS
ncbi:imidazole glycerol phosphate synthase subunit HisH [Alteromonas sp. a30]|uniref:imidazole glycerol phosphate synthase subunit HisH n=1 Tax=Alteromonas sp. a30 TaxID=2730917 RepID=UPI00227E3262|nr:imidazole glycerol phosphate synthase subunit HisH [Alteromonas sp. a30]MCY7294351.1 imidazole glycerol phosphate synthase subunit HisH [Alteromonas sp. a30]